MIGSIRNEEREWYRRGGDWERRREMGMRDWRGFEKRSGGGGAGCGWRQRRDKVWSKASGTAISQPTSFPFSSPNKKNDGSVLSDKCRGFSLWVIGKANETVLAEPVFLSLYSAFFLRKMTLKKRFRNVLVFFGRAKIIIKWFFFFFGQKILSKF